ncbi:MAG: hypothetical protein IM568_10695 [Flavobacterium sp.]|nr:hypothetical protein [Flavobacterium sp.]
MLQIIKSALNFLNWKQNNTASPGLNFNEQKEFNKIEREIKDLEYERKQIENLFAESKVADADITTKAKE